MATLVMGNQQRRQQRQQRQQRLRRWQWWWRDGGGLAVAVASAREGERGWAAEGRCVLCLHACLRVVLPSCIGR